MPLTFEKRARAASPAGSDRQQTYLFHPRYRETTRARMVGASFHSQVQDASPCCLFGKPR